MAGGRQGVLRALVPKMKQKERENRAAPTPALRDAIETQWQVVVGQFE